MPFKSGFVTIIGKPNAGKSTLLNALIGEKISIITPKVQTTRHRIKGILTTKDFQIVFSDTPGVIDPKYDLHKSMMKAIDDSIEDADVLLFLFDGKKEISSVEELGSRYGNNSLQKIIAINKSDVADEQALASFAKQAKKNFPTAEIILISALKKLNLDVLLNAIVKLLPEQNAFFSEEELTDRSERFLVSELIREKIFEQFQQEVPYSTEVIIHEWKEEKEITKIRADIIVERESQKAILLGKGGAAIKYLGIEARKSIEEFLSKGTSGEKKKIFLGLTVKVNAGWRNSDRMLKYFGYQK
ncbi:MAG TPA: GTPase Era [Chitinophagales bacterium]|nr:GTPase Era [Chitinophagales bacterium]